MKQNKHTCDICKSTSLVAENEYPKGWKRIIYDMFGEYNREQKIIDLCDVCAKKFNIEPKKQNDFEVKKTIGERLEDIVREIIESNQQ